eukprot:TRINITY_DN12121_c0_g1_i2.p2 TRINITY_DN12121_c0_g1~~TRINITY_DN12121_c0_g1_i2.p2  ORF type:complete len:277 (+),score=63.10 TRINITY_DN12121_c0_g1_i2:89-919(+)
MGNVNRKQEPPVMSWFYADDTMACCCINISPKRFKSGNRPRYPHPNDSQLSGNVSWMSVRSEIDNMVLKEGTDILASKVCTCCACLNCGWSAAVKRLRNELVPKMDALLLPFGLYTRVSMEIDHMSCQDGGRNYILIRVVSNGMPQPQPMAYNQPPAMQYNGPNGYIQQQPQAMTAPPPSMPYGGGHGATQQPYPGQTLVANTQSASNPPPQPHQAPLQHPQHPQQWQTPMPQAAYPSLAAPAAYQQQSAGYQQQPHGPGSSPPLQDGANAAFPPS